MHRSNVIDAIWKAVSFSYLSGTRFDIDELFQRLFEKVFYLILFQLFIIFCNQLPTTSILEIEISRFDWRCLGLLTFIQILSLFGVNLSYFFLFVDTCSIPILKNETEYFSVLILCRLSCLWKISWSLWFLFFSTLTYPRNSVSFSHFASLFLLNYRFPQQKKRRVFFDSFPFFVFLFPSTDFYQFSQKIHLIIWRVLRIWHASQSNAQVTKRKIIR